MKSALLHNWDRISLLEQWPLQFGDLRARRHWSPAHPAVSAARPQCGS